MDAGARASAAGVRSRTHPCLRPRAAARTSSEYTTVGFQLLPEKFTLGQLQRVYEAILGRTLDKRNFRRKMALLGILKPLDEWVRDGPSRPAQLYRFSAKHFERLRDKGILFPF